MGHARCDLLRRRTPETRPRHMGIAFHDACLGGYLPLSAGGVGRACQHCPCPARSRDRNPSRHAIDETAGQLITLIAAPLTWKSFLTGFILFRAFDIVKPPPVRQLERLPEGTGIVVDDVAAGLYGMLVMHILLHSGVLSR